MSGGNAWTGVAVAAVTAGYALVSKRITVTPVTAAMVFTGCGVLIGPAGIDVLDLARNAGPVLVLAEAALALVLFTDAMAVRGRDLHHGGFLPARLAAVALPLMIGAGWLLAWPLLPGLSLWELALVATILAPTDAAVARAAISNPRLPLLVRNGLNVECGVNDGVVLPFFILFLTALPGTAAAEQGLVGIFWRSLVLSAALGLVIGRGGGWLLRRAGAADWVGREGSQLTMLSAALAAYAAAVGIGGSGFIAAWTAGFAFAAHLRLGMLPGERNGDAYGGRPHEFAENLASLLAAMTFLAFGAVLLGPALAHLDWRVVLYALLSLTAVRMVPVALALVGSGLRLPTVAYVGWFGPRGLASLVLGLIAVEEHVPGAGVLGEVVAVTVGLSVLLHGASAVWLSERYGAWFERTVRRNPHLREAGPAAVGSG
ncbi:cation:proton antiporter [Streptomyces sp. NPDC059176]|uniref:cation:proton antiporter n=1 Tax=Streptomyces sp. NPDC059176 TaxID=3346758 RepID=UPI0036ABBF3E